MYNKSLIKFTNLYLFWLSSLSRAKINLPTYHISSITLVFPCWVSSLVISIINRITSWLFNTSKSRILEKCYVVMHEVNYLHSRNLKWIDKTYKRSCWFWIERYIVSFNNNKSYFCKNCLLSRGLLRNLMSWSTLYGNWRWVCSLITFGMGSLWFSAYFYFYFYISSFNTLSSLISTVCDTLINSTTSWFF